MEEWVEKAHNLLINSGLVKSDIVAAVNSSFDNGSIILRDNTVKMLELIEKNKIPLGLSSSSHPLTLLFRLLTHTFYLVIFSAGIKDVLEEIILHQLKDNGVSQLPPNFYILSNTFVFDNTVSDPKLVGFQVCYSYLPCSFIHSLTHSGVIMFSDILTPLPAMGIDFTIVEGKGPKIANPVKSIEVT